MSLRTVTCESGAMWSWSRAIGGVAHDVRDVGMKLVEAARTCGGGG